MGLAGKKQGPFVSYCEYFPNEPWYGGNGTILAWREFQLPTLVASLMAMSVCGVGVVPMPSPAWNAMARYGPLPLGKLRSPRRKKDQMGEGSSGPGSTLPPGAGDSEATPIVPSHEPATQPSPQQTEVASPHPATEAVPPHPATEAVPQQPPAEALPPQSATMMPHLPPPEAVPHEPVTSLPPGQPPDAPPPAEVAPHEPVTYIPPGQPPPDAPSSEVLRYGPGVPASQAGMAAESVWRTGRRPGPAPRQRRLRRLRRLLGLALTVVLLVTAGIVLYLRFFDHPPFHVTGVEIVQQTRNGCTVDVTGRIDTNGAAGTVSYQWVFRSHTQAPQPLNQSVVAGQHAVYVTVAVEGQGHGSATQLVTLDVLGPGTGADSTNVAISC